MPAAFFGVVQGQRIFGVRLAERARERIIVLRYDDQMHMVGHQAVTGDVGTVTASVSDQQGEVEAAIVRGVEYLLAIIAALSHVMRQAGNDDASTAGHE